MDRDDAPPPPSKTLRLAPIFRQRTTPLEHLSSYESFADYAHRAPPRKRPSATSDASTASDSDVAASVREVFAVTRPGRRRTTQLPLSFGATETSPRQQQQQQQHPFERLRADLASHAALGLERLMRQTERSHVSACHGDWQAFVARWLSRQLDGTERVTELLHKCTRSLFQEKFELFLRPVAAFQQWAVVCGATASLKRSHYALSEPATYVTMDVPVCILGSNRKHAAEWRRLWQLAWTFARNERDGLCDLSFVADVTVTKTVGHVAHYATLQEARDKVHPQLTLFN